MRRPEDIVGLHHLIDELLSRIEHLEAGHERLSLETEQLREENVQLREENVQLREENARLKRQVGQDSQNSHRPPSSEGYGKKPAFPKSSQKGRRGGLRGHKGQTLSQVETPDVVVPLRVEKCSCGQDLSTAAQSLLARRQCFDLPEPRMVVTEYQTFGCSCSRCGAYHTSRFPPPISAPVQYGSRVRALSCLLNVEYRLPFKKIKHLFEDLFGHGINESTQQDALDLAYRGLEKTESVIKKRLMASPVAHFDETGLRVAGRLHWLHVSSTGQETHLFVHQKRGREALQGADSVLNTFPGWAVHDSYASYFTSWPCRHSLCGAHLLRELTDAYENGSRWAKHMHRFLLALYRMSVQGTTNLPEAKQPKARQIYQRLLLYAQKKEPPPVMKTGKKGRAKGSRAYNLLQRLITHQDAVLAFAFHHAVPFTNNQAERDLRPAKVKQKVATCFRTLAGAKRYARLQAFLSTLRKQRIPVLKELALVLKEHNYTLDISHT